MSDHGDRTDVVHLRILGPVTADFAGTPARITGQRQLRVLGALALGPGRAVPAERLVADLWGDRPPRTAHAQLQTSVWMIRRALAATGARREAVHSSGTGYLLDPSACALDATRFRTLTSEARTLCRDGDPAAALSRYDEALSLWRGPALACVSGTALRSRAARLEEERVAALEQRVALAIELRRYDEAIGELLDLAEQFPLREGLRASLMLAFYRAGRQADALAVFRRTRETLTAELGIDPGPELVALEQAILRQDDALLTA